MQLELHPHGKPILEDSLGEPGRIDAREFAGGSARPHDRTEEDLARRKRRFADDPARPGVIVFRGDHEFHFVVRFQERKVLSPVPAVHLRRRRLHVHDDPRVRGDFFDGNFAMGLDRNGKTFALEARDEDGNRTLQERLAAGEENVFRFERPDFLDDFVDRMLRPALEGIGAVAVSAPEVAAGEAHENERHPDERSLALKRVEDLGDEKRGFAHGEFVTRSRGRVFRAISAKTHAFNNDYRTPEKVKAAASILELRPSR